jgi:hypothetical protein
MNQVFLNVLALSVQDEQRNSRIIAFSVARSETIFYVINQMTDELIRLNPDRWNYEDVTLSIEIADEIYNLCSNLNLDIKNLNNN